jgi:OmcA/MtrC family decaheme c-type cytochrome
MARKYCNKWLQAAFCVTLLFGAAQLCGCSGDTGAQGPPGATGPAGTPGTPGGGGESGAVTQETCNICHGTGKIADIAVAHPDPTGADVTLSNITVTNTGGTPVVSFHAATSDGPVTDLTNDDCTFALADLVPADTATASWGTWSTPYFERWAYEQTVDRRGNPSPHGTFDDTDAANGNYAYTFLTGFADATIEAPEYNEAHTQRLVIVARGRNDADGNALTNNTVGFLDFVTATAGGTVTTSDSQRLFVTADACKKCHGAPFQQAAHAPTYLDTRTCVVCHSPLGHYGTIMQRDTAYLAPLVHQIHYAIDNPRFPDEVRGLGFGGVKYPQDIQDCVVCHTDSGLALGTGDKIDNWKNHPTAEICGSCHVELNFTTGDNHPGGPQTNDDCTVCHPATGTGFGKSVTTAHEIVPDAVDIPEFDVALDITQPSNGSYYVEGEAPEVHVTLTEHGTGVAVDPSIYTTPQDEAGVTGGGLREASVYVYGPRAKSVPVLATDTITDPNFDSETDTPVQGHDMFVGGTDPQVTTDSTGFTYQLLPIPADMEAGTYMVRIRIGDYGRVGSGDYHIESTAFANLQIGTDTPSEKVAGDNCMDCHGTGTAEFHNERHAVVFDTDECLACHDQSGNFAIPIANRVHAVHSANTAGDLYIINGGTTRDWSDITFPQNIQHEDGVPRCIACHSSGNHTYETLPYMMPCAGCHVGHDGVLDHMRQNGGPF